MSLFWKNSCLLCEIRTFDSMPKKSILWQSLPGNRFSNWRRGPRIDRVSAFKLYVLLWKLNRYLLRLTRYLKKSFRQITKINMEWVEARMLRLEWYLSKYSFFNISSRSQTCWQDTTSKLIVWILSRTFDS